MLDLVPNQVAEHRRVGKVGDDPVHYLATKGGLHVYARVSKGKVHVLGAGQHPALARHLARKEEPRLVITELQKSEGVALTATEMSAGLPLARRITAELRR